MRSKYEIKAQKELEADGWIVDNKAGMGKWAKNRDFFNLFDLVCVKPGAQIVRWISIKGRAGISSKHKLAVKNFYFPAGHQKEIWSMGRNRKWRKIIYEAGHTDPELKVEQKSSSRSG